MSCTALLGDNDFQRGHAYYFPLRLLNGQRLRKQARMAVADLFGGDAPTAAPVANLSKAARAWLDALGINDADAEGMAEPPWLHVLAIGFAPAYLAENADGVRQDWPRVPLPARRELLEASAALGRQVAALLDPEAPVPGVTSGTTRPELRPIGNVSRVGGGALKPRELRLTAGWGHAGKGGVTMPGKGRLVERDYTPDERAVIAAGAKELGLTEAAVLAALGEATSDVYLNDTAYWANVPAKVWQCTIGGYQVMKKWLSYREYELLGRALTSDEAREVMNMTRRIAALLLLGPALDANYRAAAAEAHPWPSR
jgi:hypothetical protein